MGSMSFFPPRAVVEFHSAFPGSGSTTNSNPVSFDPYNPAAVPVLQPRLGYYELGYPPGIPGPHRASAGAWSAEDDQTLLRLRAKVKTWSQIQQQSFAFKTGDAWRNRLRRHVERFHKSSEPITRCDHCGISRRSPTPIDVSVDASRKSSIATPSTQNIPVAWSPSDDSLTNTPWYECPGTLNGTIPVNALPDSGSSVDAISESFANKHNLPIVATATQPISMVGGNRAESIGRVFAEFQFAGEQRVHSREFHVLRKSVCDVILGKTFLNETKTLTTFATRIVERSRLCVQSRNRLFLLDESPSDQLQCKVNGAPATALPDTGADLMLISGAFARRNGFKVHRGMESRQEVELIDGSTVWTDGMVHGAKLVFEVPYKDLPSLGYEEYMTFNAGLSSDIGKVSDDEGLTFICDLHVIEDLPSDIVLSGEFIFKNQIFSKLQCLFTEVADAWSPKVGMKTKGFLLFMRKRSPWWRPRRSARARSGTSTNIPQATTWEQRWIIEEDRRNQVHLWLSGLPEAQRSVKLAEELARQALWDDNNPRL